MILCFRKTFPVPNTMGDRDITHFCLEEFTGDYYKKLYSIQFLGELLDVM